MLWNKILVTQLFKNWSTNSLCNIKIQLSVQKNNFNTTSIELSYKYLMVLSVKINRLNIIVNRKSVIFASLSSLEQINVFAITN